MATGQAKNRHVDLICISFLFMPALLSQSGIFYGQQRKIELHQKELIHLAN